jgi:ankyrin repeat protein
MEQSNENSYARREAERWQAEERLARAVDEGDVKVAGQLLEHGVSARIRWGYQRGFALHWATYKQQSDELCRLLVQHGADADATDEAGQTALHVAATNGKLLATETLLSLGANANLKDDEGKTPLDCAFECAKDAVVTVLSPITDHRDMHAAVIAGDTEKVKTILHQEPFWATRKISINGETLLHEAVRLGHRAIIELLLDRGADVHARSDTTPLKLAYARDFSEIAELLKKYGATH